jgi:RHS repeat-associated protein
LISKLAVQGPDANKYEVRTVVKLAASGGTYVSYLLAGNNALSGPTAAGTAYALELQNPVVGSSSCSATLALYLLTSGAKTLLASSSIVCAASTELRFFMDTANALGVLVNGASVFLVPVSGAQLLTTGQPGVGAYNTPAGNSIAEADLGPHDNVAPTAVLASGIQPMAFSNHVDVQWTGTTDDANGTGVLSYSIVRNGVWILSTRNASFSDTTVSPSTTYNYIIYASDYHYNVTGTSFSVTTPAAGYIDPNRVGVQSLGTYWGGTGENIDVRSHNLNYSIPLLTAKTRGLGAGLALVYNSENWLQTPSGAWNLGADVGYGYGWTLQFGALIPVYANYSTVAYYQFTDSSGARYRLDQNSGNVWTSKNGIYAAYDANTGILHFRDGSTWQFGCTAAGTEPDAGTMYPTTIEDSNGNQIQVAYFPGNGVGWNNSSSRIDYILDVRAPQLLTGGVTYQFVYNTDTIPHLTSITNMIGTPEHYTFTYNTNQPLVAPLGTAFPNTTLLASVTVSGINTTTSFQYTPQNNGLLWFAHLPTGGYLAWDYLNYQYPGSISQPEVNNRYLAAGANGTGQITYPFNSGTATQSLPIHSSTTLDDPDGKGEKAWFFETDASQPDAGLTTAFENRMVGVSGGTRDDYTWSLDGAGNPYISADLTTVDQGLATQTQKETTQTLDAHGNLTQMQIYDYGNLTTPVRTYTNTYVYTQTGKQAYATNYLFNRLYTSTMSDGTHTVTLTTNSYDGISLQDVSSPGLHDAAYSTTFTVRGNLSSKTTLQGTSTSVHDITGVPLSTNTNGLSVAYTPDTATNSVPTTITPNGVSSLTTTLGYTAAQTVNSVTAPNNATAGTTNDAYGRPLTSTSVYGAVTTYTYNTTPPFTTTATVNGRWTKTVLDGLGRTVSVIQGNGSTAVSEVDTVYGPCGCSPMGKLYSVTQPYNPNSPPSPVPATSYVYDGLGRTTQVTLPDGASHTTYQYWVGVTQVVDPAGQWKQTVTDALGNLTTVREPNPTFPTDRTKDNWTWYSYDLLGHLTNVHQQTVTGTPASPVTKDQYRTFNYTNGSGAVGAYLLSATNPENGTVTYTYNSDGTLATKTDAKSQQVQYTYDSLKRVTIVKRGTLSGATFTENVPQRTTLTYDTATGCANGQGRLCQAQYTGMNADAGSGLQNDSYTDTYSYSSPGEVTSKQFGVTRAWKVQQITPSASLTFTANYTYDNEGRMTSASYPLLSGCGGPGCQNPTPVAGPSYTNGFDAMGRLSTMTRTDGTSQTVANNTVYNAANQITSLGMPGTGLGSGTETRSYNNLNQLTGITSPAETVTYRYPVSTNNGQIASMTSGGQTVSYTYDALGRIAAASATGGTAWGQSYVFDGFGNLLQKNVTAGSGPTLTQSVDTATNHINGFSYDANGNQTGVPVPGAGTVTATYDIENRMVQLGTAGKYAYNAQNQRVWRQGTESGATSEYFYFYGVGGQRIASYKITNYPPVQAFGNLAAFSVQATDVLVYYGSKLLQEGAYTTNFSPNYVGVDRLGSIPGGKSLYPWGEEVTATANDKIKFATYLRDGESGIDYAMNRYYSSPTGRFLTPDQALSSNALYLTGNWNRYSYVGGDPINKTDPSGFCSPDDNPPCYSATGTAPADPDDAGASWLPWYYGGVTHPGTGLPPGQARAPIGSTYIPCPPLPKFPTALTVGVIERNIAEAHAFYNLQLATNPENAIVALFSFFTVNFLTEWNYKDLPAYKKQDTVGARIFGNVNCGAVLASFGFSYYFTQNAAGVAQIGICLVKASCGEGVPLAQYPFGDQVADAADIKRGYDYEVAKENGCGVTPYHNPSQTNHPL